MGIKYVENPQTIGGKILNRRLELGLLQGDVAKTLMVTEETRINWENNYHFPETHHYPKIIAFLGYYPFTEENDLPGRIKRYRYEHGISQKHMGKKVRVHGSTIADWENGDNTPKGKYLSQSKWVFKNAV